MPGFERHLFICINERACDHPRGCCKSKGGENVRTAFKRELATRGLQKRIRANKAGCLDQCEYGITVVVYPEQVWYGGVTVDDVSEIIERHIVGGEYVTRLMLPEQPHLNGATRGTPLSASPQQSGDSSTQAKFDS